MNDWWDYIAHSEVGGERKNHKYYARVVIGADKHGNVQYRYFYDAREYGAYKTRKQQGNKVSNAFTAQYDTKTSAANSKGRTNFITGWTNSRKLPDSKTLKRARNGKSSINAAGTRISIPTALFSKRKDSESIYKYVSAKTVRNKKKKASAAQRGKNIIAKLLQKAKK